ncbi:hypothetical protein LIER_25031 [Lithospermum erythrorhizon]|uniref:Uncharacterized protein n=1 Tax=Lithospermum erythrorhizon TaxID=34254 RepID=A0AAV3R4G7_LITER
MVGGGGVVVRIKEDSQRYGSRKPKSYKKLGTKKQSWAEIQPSILGVKELLLVGVHRLREDGSNIGGIQGELEGKVVLGKVLTVEGESKDTISHDLIRVELSGHWVTNWYIEAKMCEDGKRDWMWTFIYASCVDDVRKDQFEDLRNFAPTTDLGWCLMGDLNDILAKEEKLGGIERMESSMSLFRDFV